MCTKLLLPGLLARSPLVLTRTGTVVHRRVAIQLVGGRGYAIRVVHRPAVSRRTCCCRRGDGAAAAAATAAAAVAAAEFKHVLHPFRAALTLDRTAGSALRQQHTLQEEPQQTTRSDQVQMSRGRERE